MSRILILITFLILSFSVTAQNIFEGHVVDIYSKEGIAYVNIGIRDKNIGTASLSNGTFLINIPKVHLNDTLIFSAVGYYESNLLLNDVTNNKLLEIQLIRKTTQLNEVVISAEKLVEKKYGIKRNNTAIKFSDGMFQKNDVFEIGQQIKLKGNAQITSVNLYLFTTRKDSATFRINFYKYDNDLPTKRIVEKSIVQRHPIEAGWLRFDLNHYNIILESNFVVALEFIPEPKKNVKQINYQIKLGGSSKSFFRKNSLAKWNRPPHHYCLYVTALVDKSTPEEVEEDETLPAYTLYSDYVKDSFDIFIHLPTAYSRKNSKKYPVIYQLDGNAYFDHTISSIDRVREKNNIRIEPIVVGIGYKNVYFMDSLRIRDYTFPKAPLSENFPISGGGEKFNKFIKYELIPYIDTNYSTIKSDRTIIGHSFGAYFTLFALLNHLNGDAMFNNFIAASPSLWYNDNYIIKAFQKSVFSDYNKKKLTLFMTIGDQEQDPDGDFDGLVNLLDTIRNLNMETKVYQELGHMGTAIPSIEDGLKIILTK